MQYYTLDSLTEASQNCYKYPKGISLPPWSVIPTIQFFFLMEWSRIIAGEEWKAVAIHSQTFIEPTKHQALC